MNDEETYLFNFLLPLQSRTVDSTRNRNRSDGSCHNPPTNRLKGRHVSCNTRNGVIR